MIVQKCSACSKHNVAVSKLKGATKLYFLYHSEAATYKKAVYTNFEILTGKQLRWSLFLIKLQVFRLPRAASDYSCEVSILFKTVL